LFWGRRLFALANQIKGNSCLFLTAGLEMVINLLVYVDLKNYKGIYQNQKVLGDFKLKYPVRVAKFLFT